MTRLNRWLRNAAAIRSAPRGWQAEAISSLCTAPGIRDAMFRMRSRAPDDARVLLQVQINTPRRGSLSSGISLGSAGMPGCRKDRQSAIACPAEADPAINTLTMSVALLNSPTR